MEKNKLFEETKDAIIVSANDEMWIAEDYKVMVDPPVEIHRLDSGQGRIYFTNDYQFYPGVTSVIGALSETPDALMEWIIKHGSLAAARKEMNMLAYIGSAMHTIIARLVIDKEFDIDEMRAAIHDEVNLKELLTKGLEPYSVADRLAKSVLAFERFMRDHKVVPIAIELPLRCSLGVASMVDFFVKMTIGQKGFWGEVYKSGARKGEPKETKKDVEVFAAIDFKSGMKAYSNKKHSLQLKFYEVMIKENYPEFEDVDIKLYNWHPKDWQNEIGYHLIDQTGKHELRELELMVELYRMRYNPVGKRTLKTLGKITPDSDLSKNFKIESFRDLATNYIENE